MSDEPVSLDNINELIRRRFAEARWDVDKYREQRVKETIEGLQAFADTVPGLEIKVEETGKPGHLEVIIKTPPPAEFIELKFGEE